MKKYIVNAVKVLVCLVFPAALGMSCIRDGSATDASAPDESAWMLLTVRTPQTSSLTRADDDPESEVGAIRVLVLEDTGGGFTYRYQAAGYKMEPSENVQRFRVQLFATANPLRLMVLANSEQAFDSYTPAVGTSDAVLREQLQLPFTAAGLTGNLPMYGELTLDNGMQERNATLELTAIRSIARVDVVKQLSGVDNFILREVRVYRANDRIKLNHDPAALPDPAVPVVDRPSIPQGATFLSAPVSKTEPDGAEAITQIYVPESYAAATDGDRLTNTTVVVVGGLWNGSQQVTYYRADFDPDRNFGQILRNHRYTFNIIEVSAPGWTDPQDAADNFASSIVVEAQAWQDFSSDIYFGENSFAISSRSLSLPFIDDRLRRLDVESTLDYSIQWLDANGQPTGQPTSVVGEVISNADMTVSIVKDGGDAANVSHLSFRTLHNNYTADVITHALRITVDNWSIDITVSQESPAVYSSRYIDVLSAYTTTYGNYPAGQLGTTATLPTAGGVTNGGLEMRQILDVRFSPTGTIRIGGFGFGQVGDAETSFSSATDMVRILSRYDIVYLSNSVIIPVATANAVMSWLSADSRRVLIVGMDSSETNANLRTILINQGYTGTWTFADIFPATLGFAAASAGSDDFYSGPFGSVTLTATINKHDQYLGHTAMPAAGSSITPLVKGISNGVDYMIFGVDKSRRIIYHGDANLFTGGQLTGGGAITNSLDRLMGNVWTWMVGQVIYGND